MEPKVLFIILSSVLYFAILILHGLNVFLYRRTAVLNWVNIVLHIPLGVLLFFSGVSLQLLLLIFAVSALVYTFFSFVKLKLDERSAKSLTDGEEASEN